MPHSAIEQTLSVSRFNTYRQAIVDAHGKDCPISALKLYEWNAELSSRFFFPLHIYEVALRNAISDAISIRYGQDWPINTVFQNSLNKQDRRTLMEVIGDQGEYYQSVGKLLPELRFVWFENMLTKRHDGRIWKPYIAQTFPYAPNLPPQELRKRLKDGCYQIRKCRNRIAHHEPIFNSPYLSNIYPLMSEAIDWRCKETNKWLKTHQNVTSLLAKPII